MTIVSLRPPPVDDSVKGIGFYVPPNLDNPDDNLIKKYVTPFSSGDDETLLRFLKDFEALLRMKGAGDDTQQRLQLLRILLQDQALTTFEAAHEAALNPDDDEEEDEDEDEVALRAYNAGLDAVKEEFLSVECGKRIKDAVREFKKPSSMKVMEFVNRLLELNSYIPLTPGDVPPLTDEDLLEILEKGCSEAHEGWKDSHMMQSDYPNRTFISTRNYYKLQEAKANMKKERKRGNSPPRVINSGKGRRNQYRPNHTNRPVARNRGGNGGGNSGSGGGNRRNDGNRRGGGGGDRSQPDGAVRRSNRYRSTWCPHCRTNEHDGQDCELYQAYKAGRNARQGGGNRDSQQQRGGNSSGEAYCTETRDSRRNGNRSNRTVEEEFHVLDIQSDSSCDDHELYVLTRHLPTQSKSVDSKVTPRAVLLVCLVDDGSVHKYKALVDSGASLSFAKRSLSDTWIAQPRSVVSTKTGSFTTDAKATLKILLPEFSMHREVKFGFHCDDSTDSEYDFILGRDFLQHTGLILDYKEEQFVWDDLTVPMPNYPTNRSEMLSSDQPNLEPYETPGMDQAKFVLNDVYEYIPDYLQPEDRRLFASILEKHKASFQGGIGRFPGPPYDLVMTTEDPPVHLKPYPVPHSLVEKTKAEVKRMEEFGILTRVFKSRWASPSFPIVKPNGNVRIVTDVRQVNQRVVRHPYPIPKLSDLFHRIDGFNYMSALDLSLGFYHVELSERSKEICTTIFPWGKYQYERLPMGLSVSPDIFQHKMDELLGDLPYVLIYIDDILIFTKGNVHDHLQHLDTVLGRMAEAKLQISLPKSHFFAKEAKYLGFLLSTEGIRPDPKKIKAIEALAVPTTRKQLRSFIGFCSFIRETINRYSELTAPLTSLLSTKVPFKWTDAHTTAFNEVKQAVIRATMLSFPNYSIPFEIFTDASTRQIGSVIAQNTEDGFKTIAFFAMKMTPAQMKYTVMEQELLAVVMRQRRVLIRFKYIFF